MCIKIYVVTDLSFSLPATKECPDIRIIKYRYMYFKVSSIDVKMCPVLKCIYTLPFVPVKEVYEKMINQ